NTVHLSKNGYLTTWPIEGLSSSSDGIAAHLALNASRIGLASTADALAAQDLFQNRFTPKFDVLRGEKLPLAAASF
ncbi:hypothetical protein NJC40_29090, partial [Pseudomonas sp. 21LCFQ02]|uniref:hypothetical protein n=1 Tax=Pseudomonas sp. 21LCFQ02 TaxID=2957505 RepID=UPI00209B4BE9